ncbi:hypothetical protein [Phreatobacter stygius]|uniref:Isoquinoline 1-oxidoreductase subunit n=1 Tax=Phreatobacter stygius TaxID=1940610 RepID=A0A4D7B3D2_9HYPH|nr:hypothetical protein [Phreatobacter stygius]QCI64550.1 hypothetical protein E8M01_10095 [Phreatobacter stygius]
MPVRSCMMRIAGPLMAATAVVTTVPGAAQQPTAEALRAWGQIEQVLTSPRCINCHPVSDRPAQTDDRHVHRMNIVRGPADHGAPGLHCSACHQQRNNNASGVPGAPHWKLAPRSMGWVGLTSGALCRSVKDPRANGGRSVADLVRHMTSDALVLWAWQPGRNGRGEERRPPPVSVEALGQALAVWAAANAPCPD